MLDSELLFSYQLHDKDSPRLLILLIAFHIWFETGLNFITRGTKSVVRVLWCEVCCTKSVLSITLLAVRILVKWMANICEIERTFMSIKTNYTLNTRLNRISISGLR